MIRKVILSGCYDGYRWSKQGSIEVLRKKGFDRLRYLISDYGVCRYVQYEEFLKYCGLDWEIEVNDHETIGPFAMNRYLKRDDPEAIAVLEEFGSEFCSGEDASLKIVEFDDEYFEYDIEDHDGFEVFKVYPHLTRDQVLKCNSLAEVADILEKIGVIEKGA